MTKEPNTDVIYDEAEKRWPGISRNRTYLHYIYTPRTFWEKEQDRKAAERDSDTPAGPLDVQIELIPETVGEFQMAYAEPVDKLFVWVERR